MKVKNFIEIIDDAKVQESELIFFVGENEFEISTMGRDENSTQVTIMLTHKAASNQKPYAEKEKVTESKKPEIKKKEATTTPVSSVKVPHKERIPRKDKVKSSTNTGISSKKKSMVKTKSEGSKKSLGSQLKNSIKNIFGIKEKI